MAERIDATIAGVLAELTAKKNCAKALVPEGILKKFLTKKELAHIKFNYFRRGILGLSVDSSSWLYALNLKKAKLLGKLRARLQDIKDIHLRIGE